MWYELRKLENVFSRDFNLCYRQDTEEGLIFQYAFVSKRDQFNVKNHYFLSRHVRYKL